MKFLIDAQLPRRLATRLNEVGHDAIHTLDLPAGNRTPDDQIALRADEDDRVVVTKDADFVIAHLIQGSPLRLLLISTGNITNAELERLLLPHLPHIDQALRQGVFVELTAEALIAHG